MIKAIKVPGGISFRRFFVWFNEKLTVFNIELTAIVKILHKNHLLILIYLFTINKISVIIRILNFVAR